MSQNGHNDHTGHDVNAAQSLHQKIAHWIEHLDHVLPSQAPIRDFVHHNTLHGYQHLPFDQALSTARRELGISGFWSFARFREEYAAGRIDASDLEAVLDTAHAEIDAVIAGTSTRRAIWRAVLRFPCEPVSAARLRWMLDEGDALQRVPADIAHESRRWRHGGKGDELAEMWALAMALTAVADGNETNSGARDWAGLMAEFGAEAGACKYTLRELIRQLTGKDILDTVRADLIRHCSSHLDQGLAAWTNPQRDEGFYNAWRRIAVLDPGWRLAAQLDACQHIAALPDDPVAAIEGELLRLGLPAAGWETYLQRLALQLPGWSGMFLWRHNHPGYSGFSTPVAMTDYLAVRLVLENLAAEGVARRVWGIPAQLPALEQYFTQGEPASGETVGANPHSIELSLRLACHRGELPEALASRVQQMEAPGERAAESRAAWSALAREASQQEDLNSVSANLGARAWPLFRLALCLELDAAALRTMDAEGATALLACAGELDADQGGYLWLQAYERHYSEQIFAALTANRGRGEIPPGHAPEAQLVLCMDDREEGFRRHIEETNPHLETLGGAAHFGVFQNWLGLGDTEVTPLCPVVPVVIVPSHEVREQARAGHEAAAQAVLDARRQRQDHQARRMQQSRFGLISGLLAGMVSAPTSFLQLMARLLLPVRWGQQAAGPALPPTRIELTASAEAAQQVASPENPRRGFTDDEQADRIAGFLTALGLTRHFAPLVVFMGHGSNSQNNPHLSAYDCGACSGRHSGANARLFANMANRSEVRVRLGLRGIDIPPGTYFLGAEHNTCDDSVEWYDRDDVPAVHADAFARLQEQMRRAGEAHAVERCRRLMSAPLGMSPQAAWQHVAGRRNDFAQPRPELGHVANAAAFFGRRPLTRGAYFDRRSFLVSYDPISDPQGAVLTRHLTINGPVGAGINLEYYFSTVNNEGFGCGTKTMHNVAGGLGVMAGASSDLRTGLPRQMIEIHEPMRLLVVVEQTLDVINRVYQEQPAVQELAGKGWLLLAAIEPAESAKGETIIHRFDAARGWIRWQPSAAAKIPEVERSADWFSGRREALPPALLTRPVAGWMTEASA